MVLDLPAGAKVGSIVLVTWHPSGAERIEPGTFEGRLVGIKGSRLTIHFVYRYGEDPPEETLVVNLETGMDETDHAPVSDIQAKPVRDTRASVPR